MPPWFKNCFTAINSQYRRRHKLSKKSFTAHWILEKTFVAFAMKVLRKANAQIIHLSRSSKIRENRKIFFLYNF